MRFELLEGQGRLRKAGRMIAAGRSRGGKQGGREGGRKI